MIYEASYFWQQFEQNIFLFYKRGKTYQHSYTINFFKVMQYGLYNFGMHIFTYFNVQYT